MMKKTISLGVITIVSLAVVATLGVGIYNTATGHYVFRAGGSAQHQGWNAASDMERGQGQGRRRAENKTLSENWQDTDSTQAIEPTSGGNGQGRGRQDGDVIRAESSSWVTYEGKLIELQPEPILQTGDGRNIQLGMGPTSYRKHLELALSVGDELAVTGFYEDSEFKVKELTNRSTGQSAVFRDDAGRPMWAGQGRRRNA